MARPSSFHVTLTLGKDTYASKGKTLEEAFLALELPEKIVTKGVFDVVHGKNMASIPIHSVAQLRRFNVNKLTRSIFAKRMLILVQ